MKSYSEILQINPIFQSSINLQFDINSEVKINEYIPTKEACSILRIYIYSILNDENRNDRATVLYGPYGKGKSFLVLVLLFLISTNPERETYKRLVKKIRDVDSELAELISSLNKDGTRLLPVIVNSDYGDIEQAFLAGLNEAFQREHINESSYTTTYDVALGVVESWMKNAMSNQLVENCVSQGKLKLESIHEGLKHRDPHIYEEFCNLYSCISGGMPFNPLIKKNILTTLKDIGETLPGYSGVFIVFDEFSKFIESRAVGLSQQLKTLQDVFELAVRSESKNQLHLCCINHKKLSTYSKSIEESSITSFRTVEGRVREISFTRTIGENYWLISQAIEKKNGFEEFWSKYAKENGDVFSWYLERNFVDDETDEDLFKGCFPLNPIAAYTLIQLSEMVAQNERTLFTFIADNNTNSVNSFIHNNKEGLYKVDRIYDYFSPLFEKEEGNTKNVWMNAEAILKEVNEDRERRIIKVIALSAIISDSHMFPSTEEFISASLDGEKISDILNCLKDKALISMDIVTEQYYLSHYSEKDIKKNIKEYRISKKLQNVNEELERVTPIHYVSARKYNAVHKMVRFYKVSYIDEGTFLELTTLPKRRDVFCDGTIYLVYSLDGINEEKIRERYKELKKDGCVVVGYSANNLPRDFLESLSDYCALRDLINAKISVDLVLFHEMEIMRDKKKESVRHVLNLMFSSSVWLSECLDDHSLTEIMFEQLETEFSSSPLINNELLNKEQITKIYQKPRDIIVDRILKKSEVEDLSPTSAEMSVYKSVFESGDITLEKIVCEVVKLLEDKDGEKVPFTNLINFLSSAPYGVRKGVMPLIIAKAISELPDYFIIYYGIKEIDLNPANIAKAVDKPSEYRYRVEKGTKEKEDFLRGLGKEYNVNLTGHFWDDLKRVVVEATKSVSMLPTIVRSGTVDSVLNISKESRGMVNAFLKYDINNYDTVFQTLNDCFGTKSYSETVKRVHETNDLLKTSLSRFMENLAKSLKEVFGASTVSSLKSVFDSWIIMNGIRGKSTRSLNSTERHVLEDLTSTKISFSDSDVVNILSKAVTLVEVADWQKDRSLEVTETLKSVKSKMESAEKKEKNDNSEEDTVKLSKLGEMAKRTVLESMSEYGESITDEEKVSILKSIIRELEK